MISRFRYVIVLINCYSTGLLTPEGKHMAIELLQLLTLLMPPDRRRKLHLLLRFMAKASANEKLVLDPEVPLKTLVSKLSGFRLMCYV